jgi:hypothetical protein
MMLRSTRPLVLVTIPTMDRQFAMFASEAVEGARSTDDLQRKLRVRDPRAVVRSRTLAAGLQVTWYAFRDGGWRPQQAQESLT